MIDLGSIKFTQTGLICIGIFGLLFIATLTWAIYLRFRLAKSNKNGDQNGEERDEIVLQTVNPYYETGEETFAQEGNASIELETSNT